MQPETSSQIASLISSYYTDYYKEQLGLPDWETRVKNRLSEDKDVVPLIESVSKWTNITFNQGLKILVVGAGTGAEFLALSRLGCDVYGVEPKFRAVEIGSLRAKQENLSSSQLMVGKAEHLPFPDDCYDFIWCWTVLEHVQDVEKSITEMIRVLKPWGHIFIGTPDYRHFYEPHYKMMLPMCGPKWLIKLWLFLNERPTNFIDTLQFINSRKLTNVFQDNPVVAFQIIHSWPQSWKAKRDMLQNITYWIVRVFSIQRDQYWILRKLDKSR